jgi:hypothetical protein
MMMKMVEERLSHRYRSRPFSLDHNHMNRFIHLQNGMLRAKRESGIATCDCVYRIVKISSFGNTLFAFAWFCLTGESYSFDYLSQLHENHAVAVSYQVSQEA